MWKDSIDTLLYKLAYKKEGLSGKIISEGVQTFIKEGAQAGAREITQVGLKELGQSTLKELGQSALKEGSQGLLKEGTQGISKELGQKLISEGAQSATKEGNQALAKEFGQQINKQLVQSGSNSTLKKIGIVGLSAGAIFGLDNIQTTDTNGDGVVDDKDKSLLDKGLSKTSEAVGGVAGKVAGSVAGVAGDIGGSILDGLGIDLDVVKDYAWKAFIVIIFMIALKVISVLYTMFKSPRKISVVTESKKFDLNSSIIQKV